MSLQTWQETLASAQVDGGALSASVAQTTLLPPTALVTLAPNYLLIGRTLRITASGRMSTVVTTPGTFTFFVKIGSVNVATSPAFALQTTAQTNDTWRLEWLLTTRAIGSGTNANIMHTGYWCSLAAAGSTSPNAITLLIPLTAPAVGTGFDSTISNIVDFQGQWSVNNAANSITLHQYTLEAMN
jgi:hypothetical protein